MRRRHLSLQQKLKRSAAQGRGRGSGLNYRPELKIRDVASWGRSSRLGYEGRSYVTFSDIEYAVLLDILGDPRVDEVQDQKSLELDVTLAIAAAMSTAHPRHPITGEYVVMTTDFVVALYDGNTRRLIAVSVKPDTQLRKPRVLEKLEIERRYWVRRGHRFVLITDSEINRLRFRNLDFVRTYDNWSALGIPLPEALAEARQCLIEAILLAPDCTRVADVICQVESQRAWRPGVGLALLRHLVASRVLHANLGQAMLFDLPASAFVAYPDIAVWHSPYLHEVGKWN